MKRKGIEVFLIILAVLLGAVVMCAADAPPKPTTKTEATAPVKLDELAQAKLQVLALQGQMKDLQAQKAQCEFTLAQSDRNQEAEAQQIVADAAKRGIEVKTSLAGAAPAAR